MRKIRYFFSVHYQNMHKGKFFKLVRLGIEEQVSEVRKQVKNTAIFGLFGSFHGWVTEIKVVSSKLD